MSAPSSPAGRGVSSPVATANPTSPLALTTAALSPAASSPSNQHKQHTQAAPNHPSSVAVHLPSSSSSAGAGIVTTGQDSTTAGSTTNNTIPARTGPGSGATTFTVLNAGGLAPANAAGSKERLRISQTAPSSSGISSGASTYQAAQASNLAEREQQRRRNNASEDANNTTAVNPLPVVSNPAAPPQQLLQRRNSRSVSSKSHKTDMNGYAYDSHNFDMPADRQPPSLAALHRSPSFEKRLIESARFAGTEIEEEDDSNDFTWASLCAGSCCVATSSTHSNFNSMFDERSQDGEKGRIQFTSSEDKISSRPRVQPYRRTKSGRCHTPTIAYVAKVLAVLIIILGGILLSFFLYGYLHHQELNTFRSQLSLLCLERSNTIQSQLQFSANVIQHHLSYFALIKAGRSEYSQQPFGSAEYTLKYANASDTFDYVNFILYVSALKDAAHAALWQQNLNHSIIYFNRSVATPYVPLQGFFDSRPPGTLMMPVDAIIPPYPRLDLLGWDVGNTSSKIMSDMLLAARVGDVVCSNRSSLLQDPNSFGLLVLMPLYASTPDIPDTSDDRINDLIGGVIGIVPAKLLVEKAMDILDPQPISLTFSDAQAPDNTSFLYFYNYEKDPSRANLTNLNYDESTSSVFAYGTRSYEVLCTPSQEFINSTYSSTPLLIAIGCAILFGILLIMVVLACLYSSMRRALHRSSQLIQANRNKNLALDILHEAKRISDDANKSKSDFLAFLCHELRNPLHAIVAMIDFLQTNDETTLVQTVDPINGDVVTREVPTTLSDSQKESIETIQSSVKMMSTIVNDALDMSKIEAGKITFEIMRFSFIDLVTTLAACEKPRAQAKGVQLLLSVAPNVPQYLYGDPTRIRQVVSNLLSNSIKFTNKGYVILSLSKISIENFALPMMTSVEEQGESKFMSDVSRTLPTGQGTLTGNEQTSGYGLAPGATPALKERRLGGLDGGIQEESEGAAGKNTPSGNGVAGKHSPSGNGVRHLSDIEMMPQGSPISTNEVLTPFVPDATAILNSTPNDQVPRSNLDEKDESPQLPGPSPLRKAASISGPAVSNSAVYSHVPLQPSSIPSSTPTLLDLSHGVDRPVFGQNIARETLPVRENSSRTQSAFASENAIIEISITDTGSGIDPSALPLLFEPYSQAKLSIFRSSGGSGLGLAIVKQIVEMMCGSISVKSQLQSSDGTGGTTMTIRLPLPTAPSVDPSSEVSENSNVSSNSSRAGAAKTSHSREELFRRSGSTAVNTALMNDDGTFGVFPAHDGTGVTSSPPAASNHLSGLNRTGSGGTSSHSGGSAGQSLAPTPQSVYSTMDLPSRSAALGSTPSYAARGMASLPPSGVGSNPRELNNSATPYLGGSSASLNHRSLIPATAASVITTPPFLTRTSERELVAPEDSTVLSQASLLSPPDESLEADNAHDEHQVVFHDETIGSDEAETNTSLLNHSDPTNLVPTETQTDTAASVLSDVHSPFTVDVRHRLAALASLPDTAKFAPPVLSNHEMAAMQESSAASASTNPSISTTVIGPSSSSLSLQKVEKPNKPLKARHAVSTSSSGRSALAAALASMSLQPASEVAANSLSGGSIAQLAAQRSAPTVVYPKDVHILIADDSATNLKILSRMLTGFKVTQALNGQEAVDRVKELIDSDPPLKPFPQQPSIDEDVAASAEELSRASTQAPNNSGNGQSSESITSPPTQPITSPFSAGFAPQQQQAFVRQKGKQFDCILSDVLMPVMDGHAASREIRKIERLYHLPPVPIVALTANAFLDDRNKCAAAGMSFFVSKPFNKKDILSIVELICQQNNMQLILPSTSSSTTPSSSNSATVTPTGSNVNSPLMVSQHKPSLNSVNTPTFSSVRMTPSMNSRHISDL